jgi:glycosyltransferase involved in cell wall biosynthesis
MRSFNRLKIFTWHIHGSYLYYLSQGPYDIYIPVGDRREEGYYGRGQTFPFGPNVIEVPAGEVRDQSFDCILYQTNKNFLIDQYEILSESQRLLPRIYLEHDPPREHPTDSVHIMRDGNVCLVHVTPFNRLMWSAAVPMVKVIDHGICPSPGVSYSGELDRGIVVINHLHQRGRKLGADLFDGIRKEIPLDLAGMGTAEHGGLGEVLHPLLPAFISRYRFFFNPIRYTSLGLSFLEAMMSGIPVVALATTEYSTVIRNEVSGYIHTDIRYLTEKMRLLLQDRDLASELGRRGREEAENRFGIKRFTRDWENLFDEVIHQYAIHQHETHLV